MTSLVLKSRTLLSQVGARSFHITAVANKQRDMPDPLEHATGMEKYELLAKQAGNEDPFFLKAFQRGVGTKENPNIVNAMENYRMVGCVCNEEDTNVKWMWICEGAPKRCECGYWFQLKQHAPVNLFQVTL